MIPEVALYLFKGLGTYLFIRVKTKGKLYTIACKLELMSKIKINLMLRYSFHGWPLKPFFDKKKKKKSVKIFSFSKNTFLWVFEIKCYINSNFTSKSQNLDWKIDGQNHKDLNQSCLMYMFLVNNNLPLDCNIIWYKFLVQISNIWFNKKRNSFLKKKFS